MLIRITLGVILLLIGFFHIFFPKKSIENIRIAFKHSPIVKDENKWRVRPFFMIIFGIIWVFSGVFVLAWNNV